MRINLCIGLLIFVVGTLTSCSKSKDKFAPQLAEDIIDTWSQGARKGELSPFSDLDYANTGRGIALHRKEMSLLGGLLVVMTRKRVSLSN